MKTNFNVYLWVDNEGWEFFENVDDKELKDRLISIGDGALIGNRALIGDNTTPIIIHIIGSKHPLSYWGEDRIDIGCKQRKVNFWYKYLKELIKNMYRFMGKRNSP